MTLKKREFTPESGSVDTYVLFSIVYIACQRLAYWQKIVNRSPGREAPRFLTRFTSWYVHMCTGESWAYYYVRIHVRV